MRRSVCAFTPLYDAISSWISAGALTNVDVEQAKAIQKAGIEGKWRTASKLIEPVLQGKLSGSASTVTS